MLSDSNVGSTDSQDEFENKLRMEKIRQNTAQYNFDYFQSILKRKEKKFITDPRERAELQLALAHLKEYETLEELEFHKFSASVKTLASLINSNSTLLSDGSVNFEREDFKLVVVLDSKNPEVRISLFGSELHKSDTIKALLSDDYVAKTASAINRTLQRIPLNCTSEEKNVCLLRLANLEADLLAMRDSNYASYALQFCVPGSEINSFTVILLEEPFLRDAFNFSDSIIRYDNILYTAYLCLSKSDILNPFPDVSFLNGDSTVWQFSPFPSGTFLPLEFLFRLSRPILLLEYSYKTISAIDGVSVNILRKVSFARHLSDSYESVPKLTCEVSPDYFQEYQIEVDNPAREEDVIIDGFSFSHPSAAIEVLRVLRDQLMLNVLFESICQRSVSTSKKMANLRISTPKEFSLHVLFSGTKVTVSVLNGSMILDVEVHGKKLTDDPSIERWADVLRNTFSIPLLMHLVITEGEDKNMFEAQNSLNKNTSNELPSEEETIEPYHEFLRSDCLFDAGTESGSYNKVGQSWINLNMRMRENTKKATAVPNGISSSTAAAHPSRHSFTVVDDSIPGEKMSLLRAAKNVEVSEELIPPVLQPAQFPRHPFAQISRGSSLDHQQTPRLTRHSVDSSTPAALNNAFSDLEAIAEIGADDTESQVSAEEPHLSSRSSSMLETYSPSGGSSSQQTPGTGGSGFPAMPSRGPGAPTPMSIQLSPIEHQQHKMTTTSLYRRRLMQQPGGGTSASAVCSPSEVFDFVPDDQPGGYGACVQGMRTSSMDDLGTPYSAGPGLGQFPTQMGQVPPYQSSSGRRRGRRKGGNIGDRHPSIDQQSASASAELTPDSPFGSDFGGNGRKRRGGVPSQRGQRKPRAKPQNLGGGSETSSPTSSFVFPTAQFPLSAGTGGSITNLPQFQQRPGIPSKVPLPNSFIISPTSLEENSRLLNESRRAAMLEFEEESEDDDDTDPPPAPRNLESASEPPQTHQLQRQQSTVEKTTVSLAQHPQRSLQKSSVNPAPLPVPPPPASSGEQPLSHSSGSTPILPSPSTISVTSLPDSAAIGGDVLKFSPALVKTESTKVVKARDEFVRGVVVYSSSTPSSSSSPSSTSTGLAVDIVSTGVSPCSQQVKVQAKTHKTSVDSQREQSPLQRKPSVQSQTAPSSDATTSSQFGGPKVAAFLDLYDNQLDEQTRKRSSSKSKKEVKEKKAKEQKTKPRERASEALPYQKDKESSSMQRQQKRSDASSEPLKPLVIKLGGGRKGGDSARTDSACTKYSSSSSSPSSTSSQPVSAIFPTGQLSTTAQGEPPGSTSSTTEPITRLSGSGAPPSKSKSKLSARFTDLQQQPQQQIQRPSTLTATKRPAPAVVSGSALTVDEGRKKKPRKESPSISPASATLPSSSGKSGTSQGPTKLSSVSGSTKRPFSSSMSSTTASITTPILSAPSSFFKSFKIPKVTETESSAEHKKSSSSSSGQQQPQNPPAREQQQISSSGDRDRDMRGFGGGASQDSREAGYYAGDRRPKQSGPKNAPSMYHQDRGASYRQMPKQPHPYHQQSAASSSRNKYLGTTNNPGDSEKHFRPSPPRIRAPFPQSQQQQQRDRPPFGAHVQAQNFHPNATNPWSNPPVQQQQQPQPFGGGTTLLQQPGHWMPNVSPTPSTTSGPAHPTQYQFFTATSAQSLTVEHQQQQPKRDDRNIQQTIRTDNTLPLNSPPEPGLQIADEEE